MASEIVSINVGGKVFQTSPKTMCKYPNSKLGKMYQEGKKIKNRNFFLDEDPKYFRVVLNFLRKDKVTLEEPHLFNGILDLAKNLELHELVEELETVVLSLNGKKEIKIHASP